jgi:hypothetical protein
MGVPIYKDRLNKQKQGVLQIGNWKDNEWPPERIIQYYGPATWAEDGSWLLYPIYMLSHIISLQAVVEIRTNETTRALNLLVKQSTKMCNATYQNCLALDYLLASEEGVCGNFNLSNCYLQVDNEENIIEEITDRMRTIAHVPIQIWRGWNPNDLFGGWWIQNPDRGDGPCPGIMFNITLPGSLSIAVYQDHYGGHYRKKTSHQYNDPVEI